MIAPYLDFRHLKRVVSIEQVLTDKGLLPHLRRRAGALVGPCPLHKGDNPSAFVVSLDKNLWRCFTGCDAGGDVVELVRRLETCTYRQAALYLAALAHQPPLRSESAAGSGFTTAFKLFRPFPHRLRLQTHLRFFQQKGISPETAYRFEAGGYSGSGFLHLCVAVRLHDPDGLPLGYAGRRLDPTEAQRYGKWKFPLRLPRNRILYNFHRIRSQLPAPLVLTECPWSVMRLYQIGVPAVALLGLHLSPTQRQLLGSATRIRLLFDGDPAGRNAAARIQQHLALNADIRILNLPDGADPDDLNDTELRHCLAVRETMS